MSWDIDTSEWTIRYRRCRTGFAFCAVGLALLAFDAVCYLAFLCIRAPELGRLLRGPVWEWTIGLTITWATLIGPCLLWGCRADPRWRRRAWWLVTLNLVDIAVWFLGIGPRLGLWPNDVGHPWLRTHVVLALSWIQFALFASLAADLAVHLGSSSAGEARRRVHLMAVVGGLFWAFAFVQRTAWHRGWPLVPRPFHPLTPLLWIGLTALRVVASFQAAVLCALACRASARMVRELAHARQAPDRFGPLAGTDPDDWWRSPDHDAWT